MLSFANKFSIKQRVFFQAAFFIMLITAISGYALYASNEIGHEISNIAHDDIPLTKTLTEVTSHQLEQAIHMERVIRYSLLNDASQVETEIKAFTKLSHMVDEEMVEAIAVAELAISHTNDPNAITEIRTVVNSLSTIAKSHKSFEKHAKEAFIYARDGTIGQHEDLINQLQEEEDYLDHGLEALLLKVEDFTEQAVLTTEAHEKEMIFWLSTSMVLAIIGGLFIAWLVLGSISLRLKILRDQLQQISAGNLGDDITGTDDIADYLREMQTQLKTMVHSILASVERLSATTSSASISMTQTAANIQQQQSQTEQVATAMVQMSASIEEVSDRISESAIASTAANDETESSKQVVHRSAEQVSSLAKQIDNAAHVVEELNRGSENISGVLEVIVSIAEQTNLLALNAAIEAARAGEQGRGFAVVADEVRNLAKRTQESTKEIHGIIEKLQEGAKQAAAVMTTSQEQSRAVVEGTVEAQVTLDTISQSINQISDRSGQIATAATEQQHVTEEMARNINLISDMSASNTESTQETVLSMRELEEMSTELKGLVSNFIC